MAFSPDGSTNYIFFAKKYPFFILGLGLRLGEGCEDTQGEW